MKQLENVCFFGADTLRSRAYISLLLAAGIVPKSAIIIRASDAASLVGPLSTKLFDGRTPVGDQLAGVDVPVIHVSADTVNDAVCAEAIRASACSYAVFSGPSGAIVGPTLFETGTEFIHVHPGPLPALRGSTTIYYSLLLGHEVTATGIILRQKIDEGDIIGERTFSAPEDRTRIDLEFDPYIRAVTLVSILSNFIATQHLVRNKQESDGDTVYVIHPVLKHIALLANTKDS